MLQKFKKHIETKFPFLQGKKLLIAISGGIDSVVLTHLLSELNFDISLAHCNFNLRRKESGLDEEFVKKLSQKTSNQIFTINFETEKFARKNKQSTQIAARNLRYNWFKELTKEHNFEAVLTGHHADDNLETFLINLTRGSGLDGFTGIPEINGNIVRPLLIFSRDEIINYAKENNIEWREDASNASTKYIRNKIRHQVVPVLKEINPSLLESFSKTTENLKESKEIIIDRIDEVSLEIISSKNNSIRINIEEIQQLSNPKAYLYQLLKKYQFTEWNDVSNLLSAQSGKQILSETHRLIKNRDFLLISEINFSTAPEITFEVKENQSEIIKPIHLTFEEVHQKTIENKQTIYVAKELLSYPLTIRKWENGDYFYPSGMTGKKKLSKYFKDEKFSLLEKEQTWLLCNSKNEIIWVIGKRQDNRFMFKKTNSKNIKVTIREK
ncbi:MAG: tRNA lysidine(34) synthetase TilS [Polaribacter sp.]|uniref:tRNA lysidine(34) synthetase TilS n=1 Tax=Polaribacter sp. TaxID=1920175 RepID=UPI002F352992